MNSNIHPQISPTRTMTMASPFPKRPRSSPSEENVIGAQHPAKRLQSSQSPTQSSASTANDAVEVHARENDGNNDDTSSFELDLSTCPEFHTVNDKMSQLQLNDPMTAMVEEGDEMQKAAISHAENGDNLFLTGKAGTGKSWTSKQIRAKLGHRNMWVVAPTGVAAINVDGMTVHAWGGFGRDWFPLQRL